MRARAVGLILAWCSTSAGLSLPGGLWSPRPAAALLGRSAVSPLPPAAPHHRDNGALNTKDGHEEMLRRSADLLSMDVVRAAEANVEERGRLIDESHRLWHQGEKRAAELIDVQVAELREKVWTMVAWSKAILPLDMQQDEDDGLPVGTRFALYKDFFFFAIVARLRFLFLFCFYFSPLIGDFSHIFPP